MNSPMPTPPEFMTWIDGRSTNDGYKVHKSLGHANNSIHGNAVRSDDRYNVHYSDPNYDYDRRYVIYRHCQIFKWNGTGWDLLYDIPAGTSWADRPWRKNAPLRASESEQEY